MRVAERRPPPARQARRLAGTPGEPVRGRELPRPLEGRAGRGHVAEVQVEVQRLGVGRGRRSGGVGQERARLAREAQRVGVDPVVERLLAGPVAGQEQGPRARVPDRQREHAVQRVDQLGAALLPQVDQDLGVAPAAQPVPAGQQPLAQGLEVVDLPVEGDPHRAVLVGQRLGGRRREVDHAQPAVPQRGRPLDLDPLAVGPAVRERAEHGPHRPGLARPVGVLPHQAGDPAHASSLQRSGQRARVRCALKAWYAGSWRSGRPERCFQNRSTSSSSPWP